MNEQFPEERAATQQPDASQANDSQANAQRAASQQAGENLTQRIAAQHSATTHYPSVQAPQGPAQASQAAQAQAPTPEQPAAGQSAAGQSNHYGQANQQTGAWGQTAWDQAPEPATAHQQSAPYPAYSGQGGNGGHGTPPGAWTAAPQPRRRKGGLKWALGAGALALAVVAGAVPGWALGHQAGSTQASSQNQVQNNPFGQSQNGKGQNGQSFGQNNGSNGSSDGSDGSSDGSNGLGNSLPGGGSSGGSGGQQFQQLPYGYGYGNGSGGSNGSNSDIKQGTAMKSGVDGLVLVDTLVSGGEGAGTGMILSSDGYVLTNYHVVEGSTEVKVTDSTTGKEYTGEVVGHDATHDVALVKLKDASGLKTVSTASGSVNTGDEVAAIGNSSGEGYLRKLTGSVTATDQSITTQAEATSQGERLSNLIQTDADVVPGYSGGALVNSSGEVVGMTTAASSGNTSATVDGYAIPISEAIQIANQIKDGQSSSTIQIGRGAALGISVLSADTGQVGGGYGVTVQEVIKGGAVADSGIKAGDTIIGLDGKSVKSYSALKQILSGHKAGDKVELVWLDGNGKQSTKTVTLGESSVN